MKRSEMVNEIIATIQRSCGSYEDEILYPPDEYLAEVILRAIEAKGMQPPSVRQYVLPEGRPEFAYMEFTSKWENE